MLGRVIAARIEARRGYAALKFTRTQHVELVGQRIADGTLQSISVGYRAHCTVDCQSLTDFDRDRQVCA